MENHRLATATAGRRAELGALFPWWFFPLLVLCALVIVGLDVSDGMPYLADVDDRLRALQVSQLLSSWRWFDLTLPMIRMPEAYVSPWSRLIDLPYALLSLVLSVFMDRQKAMHWSFQIWPPMLLLAYCMLVMRIIRGLAVRRLSTGGFVAVAMMLFMVLAICGFSPGRIDHHNVQILLLLAMVAGVLAWNGRGGFVVGITTALSLAIGLECMPIVATLLGDIVLAWVLGAEGAAPMLRTTMLTAAISTPVTALVMVGPTGFMAAQCDMMSAAYIHPASLLALTAAGAGFACGAGAAPYKKVLAILVPAAAIAAGFLWLFPACAGGPYGIIDPVSRAFWFSRLRQENSALEYFRDGLFDRIALLAGQALIMLLALPGVLKQLRLGRPQPAIAFATSLSALLMALMLIRSLEFPAALVPLFLPSAFQGLVTGLEAASRRARALSWIAASCLSVMATVAIAWLLTPPAEDRFDMVDFLNSNDCAADAISAMAWPPSAIIMAPPTLGFTVAEHVPEGLAVSAIAFHRASPGLRRTYLALTTSDSRLRRDLMAPFDYVAVCRDVVPVHGEAPLYKALASGGGWPGLVPFGDDDPHRPLRLFRIDHSRLE